MTIFNVDPNSQIVVDFNHFILIGIHTENSITTIKFAKIYLYGNIDDFQMLAEGHVDPVNFIQNSTIRGSVEYLLTAATSVQYVSSICETIEMYGARMYFKVFDEMVAENVNPTLIAINYEELLTQLSMNEMSLNATNSLISPYLSAQLQSDKFTL